MEMKYQVTATIDGETVDVICDGTDQFIDVCEELGNNVIRVVEWERGNRAKARELVIDWL